MKRKIIEINEKLCNGCGLCVSACHEGAIQMINGKAKLVSDEYCDGLGDCLPACPTGAINIIEREAAAFDEDMVKAKIDERNSMIAAAKELTLGDNQGLTRHITAVASSDDQAVIHASRLGQWPVQLRLINPNASFLKEADLLIAADCTAYAYGNFHETFIKGKVTIIACPKLDDNQENLERFKAIFQNNKINSVTVVRMEVPCCNGITTAVKEALSLSDPNVSYNEVTISTDGRIL